MRRRNFFMVWVFFFVLIISFLTFASDKDVVRIQGRVMEVDLGNRMMIVNEKTFIWDQNTKFYNEKCTPITVDRLRAKTWVYIEGVRDTFKKRVIAGKIYLLPKHISEKEKNLYCFFNETKSIED